MNTSDMSQRPNPTRFSADNDSRPRTTIREMRRSLSYEDSNSPSRRHPDASLMRTPRTRRRAGCLGDSLGGDDEAVVTVASVV